MKTYDEFLTEASEEHYAVFGGLDKTQQKYYAGAIEKLTRQKVEIDDVGNLYVVAPTRTKSVNTFRKVMKQFGDIAADDSTVLSKTDFEKWKAGKLSF